MCTVGKSWYEKSKQGWKGIMNRIYNCYWWCRCGYFHIFVLFKNCRLVGSGHIVWRRESWMCIRRGKRIKEGSLQAIESTIACFVLVAVWNYPFSLSPHPASHWTMSYYPTLHQSPSSNYPTWDHPCENWAWYLQLYSSTINFFIGHFNKIK